MIALFGICVQNDVILPAKINDLRKQGLGLRKSIIQGALTKFRAIFMTKAVMIVGVLPLAPIETTGSELHRPLAVVHIGGFFFTIIVKMITVPVLYELFARLTKAERVTA